LRLAWLEFGLGDAAEPDLVDAPAIGFEHFDDEAIELERFARARHAAHTRQYEPGDCLGAIGLDVHTEALAHLVDVHLRAEHPRSVAFVDDRFGLDIVFVLDLADDLLE
jgi:hypothetical protein